MSRATLRQARKVRKLGRRFERKVAELELAVAEYRMDKALCADAKVRLAANLNATAKNLLLAAVNGDLAMLRKMLAQDEARRASDEEQLLRKQAGGGAPFPNRPAADLAATLVRETEWALEHEAEAGHEPG